MHIKPVPGARAARGHRPHTAAGALHAQAGPLERRLWRKLDHALDSAPAARFRVLMAGFPVELRGSIAGQLRDMGVLSTASMHSVHQLGDLAGMAGVFTHVLVDFDAFEDVASGVEALLALRSAAPDLVVVLFSSQVAGDDLGAERSAICDATLRVPVSPTRLRRGMTAASENHGPSRRVDCDARMERAG